MKWTTRRSGLHDNGWVRSAHELASGGVRGERKLESVHEQLLFSMGLGVTAHDQGAPIGGWEVPSEHLDTGERIEHGT